MSVMPASGLVSERMTLLNLLRINIGVNPVSVLEQVQDGLPETSWTIHTVERTINTILEPVQVPTWFHETLAHTRDIHSIESFGESQEAYPTFNTREEVARVWKKFCIDNLTGVLEQPPPCFKTIIVTNGTQMEGWVLSSLSIAVYLDELAAAEEQKRWELEIWSYFFADPDVQELSSTTALGPMLSSFEPPIETGSSSAGLVPIVDLDVRLYPFEPPVETGALSSELGSFRDATQLSKDSVTSSESLSGKRKLEDDVFPQINPKRTFGVQTVRKLIGMIKSGDGVYKAFLQKLISENEGLRIRSKENTTMFQLLRTMVQPVWFHAAILNYRDGIRSGRNSALVHELKLIGGESFTTDSVKYIETWVSLCIEPLERWATTGHGKRPCHPLADGDQPKNWFILRKSRMIEYLESLIS